MSYVRAKYTNILTTEAKKKHKKGANKRTSIYIHIIYGQTNRQIIKKERKEKKFEAKKSICIKVIAVFSYFTYRCSLCFFRFHAHTSIFVFSWSRPYDTMFTCIKLHVICLTCFGAFFKNTRRTNTQTGARGFSDSKKS